MCLVSGWDELYRNNQTGMNPRHAQLGNSCNTCWHSYNCDETQQWAVWQRSAFVREGLFGKILSMEAWGGFFRDRHFSHLPLSFWFSPITPVPADKLTLTTTINMTCLGFNVFLSDRRGVYLRIIAIFVYDVTNFVPRQNQEPSYENIYFFNRLVWMSCA